MGDIPDEPYIKTRARVFKALGYAELMCVALNRATKMIKDIPSKFSASAVVPNTVNAISPALTAMRNAIEHIEDRAFGNVFGQTHPDALTIFDQDDFFAFGVLRYAGHSLDVRAEVVPALVSFRQFIFEVAVEKAGAARTNNVPLEFFGNDNRSLSSQAYNSQVQDLSKTLELDPSFTDAYCSRGAAYLGQGDFGLAIRDLDRAIGLDPNFVNAYYTRGTAHLGKGDVDLAIRDYSKAIELNPNFSNAFCNRGIAYGGKGDFGLAIRDFDRAIELDPNFASAFCNRGIAHRGKGDIDLAIQDYGKAIELNPDFSNAYYNRGVTYDGKDDVDLAIQDYGKVIELNPNLAGAYCSRGTAYIGKGDADLAIQDYGKAIELNPNSTDAFSNRGIAYGGRGEYDLAIQDLSRALELDPKLHQRLLQSGRSLSRPGCTRSSNPRPRQGDRIKPEFRQCL